MSAMLKGLLSLLALEAVDDHQFRGASVDLGFRQALGQALSAAIQTVDSERLAHSMHGYFLRPGGATPSSRCSMR